MKAIIQYIVRRSGWAAFYCFLFAFVNGCYVFDAFRQGVGLRGTVTECCHRNGGGSWTVGVQSALHQSLGGVGAGCVFLLVALWSKRRELTKAD